MNNRFTVQKTPHGLFVQERDTGAHDYLTRWEGIIWRTFRYLPERIRSLPTIGTIEFRRALREMIRSKYKDS